MKSLKTIILILNLFLSACFSTEIRPTAQHSVLAEKDPSELYGELFNRVQQDGLFIDSKYFVDMEPLFPPQEIMLRYQRENPKSSTQLLEFVNRNFVMPAEPLSTFKSKSNESIDEHIGRLWQSLKKEANVNPLPASSLIGLPYPYIVPGGRFREIYYWDSYFTQIGLLADKQDEAFQNMVRNFVHMIMTLGRIPNGNRDYYRGRSQPPFFSHMVSLWQDRFGNESSLQFIEPLKREHQFWMSGERVVQLDTGALNRYWDDRPKPRPEAYREDVALAQKSFELYKRPAEEVYRDLRAGAESGWDYSTRWFKDPKDFATIQTTSLIPIDLNALLYHLEMKISELATYAKDKETASHYLALAHQRRQLIHRYLWSKKAAAFADYNWKTKQASAEITLAVTVPLFVGVASKEQAQSVAKSLEKKFLRPGGLVTTLRFSSQQWDAPNGWAPHQWMAYAGLKKYKQDRLAEIIRERWVKLNERVFKSTGKIMEKYNVEDIQLESGGGEYPLQDGFGWTNGVYRALRTPDQSLKHVLGR